MKKYFINGEELNFGDVIEIDLKDKLSNGKALEKHLECKFHPALVDMLLEAGVIEEKEDESCKRKYKHDDGIDKMTETLEGLNANLSKVLSYCKDIESRVTDLEGTLAELSSDEEE